MSVDPRAKGARTETTVRDLLKKHTGLAWERVPGSGALDPKHQLKGDLYVPGRTEVNTPVILKKLAPSIL